MKHKSLLLWLLLSVLGSGSALADGMTLSDSRWSVEFDEAFQKYAARYFGPGFDWRWFKAQAIAESGLNPQAVSQAGARGLMQLLPSTYGDIRREQSHFGELGEPRWNIAGGIYYDRMLFRKWSDLPEQERLYFALASYNAGYARIRRAYNRTPGEVKGWEQVKHHVPAETRGYVARIRRLMGEEVTPLRLVQLTGYFAGAE